MAIFDFIVDFISEIATSLHLWSPKDSNNNSKKK